jgi:type I restriction-modification system DNA methylase subunit
VRLRNSELIQQLRDWDADNVERENERISRTGEHFTPTALIEEVLDKFPKEHFSDPNKTTIDPSCGNGQFLSGVLIRKLANGISHEQALSTLYGVDIMLDNVKICQDRLLCGVEELRWIVEKNIVCADALTYDFSFK